MPEEGSGDENRATATPPPTETATETQTATPAASLDEQLQRVREATTRYEDPTRALADGFDPGGPYVPGMGWHFQHPERLGAAAESGFTIEQPPILTYLETDAGLRLGAVEYAAPAAAVPDDPDLFDDDTADATEQWHTHKAATHVFALPDDTATSLQDLTLSAWTTRGAWTEFSPPDRDLQRGDTVSLNGGHPTERRAGARNESSISSPPTPT